MPFSAFVVNRPRSNIRGKKGRCRGSRPAQENKRRPGPNPRFPHCRAGVFGGNWHTHRSAHSCPGIERRQGRRPGACADVRSAAN